MMQKPLNQAIKQLFESKSLPLHRWAALNKRALRHRYRSGLYARPALVVGASVLFAMAVLLASLQYHDRSSALTIHQRIADEVAVNHIKLKPLEVNASGIDGTRAFFKLLNFELIEPAALAGSSWQMLGGRFCTIQGEAAAQLRMTLGGNVQTLYQAPYARSVHGDLPAAENGEEPLTLYSHGLTIRLWRERGLLLATAS